MAAVTHRTTYTDTTDQASYTTSSFTPALDELLVILYTVSAATIFTPTITDSQNLGWTALASKSLVGGNAGKQGIWSSNKPCAASSMTITLNFETGTTPSGIVIFVAGVSGMTRFATSTRANDIDNGAAASTPTVIWPQACLTGNPTLLMIANNSNPAALTEPSGWTEQGDTGFATPTFGAEYVTRDSGFTGSTVTWQSTSASVWNSTSVQLNASNLGGTRADSATLTEGTTSIAGTVTAAESATLTEDAGALAVSIAPAIDASVITEASALAAAMAASDTVALTEAAELAELFDVTDTAALTEDASSLAITAAASDVGTVAEDSLVARTEYSFLTGLEAPPIGRILGDTEGSRPEADNGRVAHELAGDV